MREFQTDVLEGIMDVAGDADQVVDEDRIAQRSHLQVQEAFQDGTRHFCFGTTLVWQQDFYKF